MKLSIWRLNWAIALKFNHFTREVGFHDATLNVKLEDLNETDSPEVHRQLPHILQRILRLRTLVKRKDVRSALGAQEDILALQEFSDGLALKVAWGEGSEDLEIFINHD
jgi:hypothetical protein